MHIVRPKAREIALTWCRGRSSPSHFAPALSEFFCRTSNREARYSFIVGPDGLVYKCYGAIGDSRYAIGSVNDRIDDIYSHSNTVVELELWDDDCFSCPIFPLCRGGCQAISAVEHNGEYGHRLRERHIWKPILEEALEHGYF